MEERLAALLREAGRAHHQAFLETHGEDAQWPAWYARYLADPLGQTIGSSVNVERLATVLSALEAARERDGIADWPRYYAARVAELAAG
ncbi:MAG: hypothetical protein L0271_23315 [Gemmatimonadetes bacterium]|nr:hypothetical protein [Gemmatimonadota bacterium]